MTATERMPGDLPPTWLFGALLAMLALHEWLPLATLLEGPWTSLGFVLIGAASVVLFLCLSRFYRAKTGIRPFTPAHELVVDGAFRFSRNPMYVGLLGVCLGVAIRLGTVSPMAVPPLLFLLLDRRFVRREEIFLRERFGAAFDDYCGRVRRWL